MRVAPSLASYGSDPMHLLRVPLLYSQYCTCLLYPFNKLSGSVDYMKYLIKAVGNLAAQISAFYTKTHIKRGKNLPEFPEQF